jgi:hypothetical protein
MSDSDEDQNSQYGDEGFVPNSQYGDLDFMKEVCGEFKIQLIDRDLDTKDFVRRILDLCTTNAKSGSACDEAIDVSVDQLPSYADIRNAGWVQNLSGQKFDHMVDTSRTVMHKTYWTWVYGVCGLPYLSKFTGVKTNLMTAGEVSMMKQRSNKVGNMMLTFMYDVSTNMLSYILSLTIDVL